MWNTGETKGDRIVLVQLVVEGSRGCLSQRLMCVVDGKVPSSGERVGE